MLRLPSGSRAAQIAAFDELGAGLGQTLVGVRRCALRRPGTCCAAATSSRPWDPALSPRELTDLLDQSRDAAQAAAQRAFKDERLAAGRQPPVRHRRPRPAQRAGLAGRDVLPRADLRRLDGAGRAAGHRRRRSPSGSATRGVAVELDTSALDLVLREGRVVGVRTDDRRPRRRRRRVRDRPAPTAGARADSCSGRCRPSRRSSPTSASRATCPTCRTRWCCTATRCWSSAPAAPPPTAAPPGPCTAAAGSPRTCSARWPGTGSTSAQQRRHPHRPLPARPRRRAGAAPPRACSGRAARRCGDRLGPTTPIPGVYAAGAHATPGSGLPFVGLSAALVAQAVGPA